MVEDDVFAQIAADEVANQLRITLAVHSCFEILNLDAHILEVLMPSLRMERHGVDQDAIEVEY